MKTKNIRCHVATLLDETLPFDGRGPRTFNARRRLAAWLDSGRKHLPTRLVSDVHHLEDVLQKEGAYRSIPKDNPRQRGARRFKPPFSVDFWEERGEMRITVYDANDRKVVSWDTDEVIDLIESGFLDTSGYVMGRVFRPGRLEQSVLDYLEDIGVIPSAELA